MLSYEERQFVENRNVRVLPNGKLPKRYEVRCGAETLRKVEGKAVRNAVLFFDGRPMAYYFGGEHIIMEIDE